MMQRVLQQAKLMDSMMECIGVEPVRAARMDKGMAWYEARSRCIACVHDRRCAAWISGQITQTSAPPEYCGNAEFFRQTKTGPSEGMEDHHESTLANMHAALATEHAQSPGLQRA